MERASHLIESADQKWDQAWNLAFKVLKEKTGRVVLVASMVLGLVVVYGPPLLHQYGIELPHPRISLPSSPGAPMGWPYPAGEETSVPGR